MLIGMALIITAVLKIIITVTGAHQQLMDSGFTHCNASISVSQLRYLKVMKQCLTPDFTYPNAPQQSINDLLGCILVMRSDGERNILF